MFSHVYTVGYESQYSVIILNCFSTPAVVTVAMTPPFDA